MCDVEQNRGEQGRFLQIKQPFRNNGQICLSMYPFIDAYISVQYCVHPGTGWLRLVGSIQLQISYEKENYKRDDIMQKRNII